MTDDTIIQFEMFSDTQGPRVQLTNNIPRATNNPKTRITWSSNEPGTFVCLLDGVEVSCGKGTTGDYTTPDLSDGKHSLCSFFYTFDERLSWISFSKRSVIYVL